MSKIHQALLVGIISVCAAAQSGTRAAPLPPITITESDAFSMGGDLGINVTQGDVVLCEGAAPNNTACAGVISDIIRFTRKGMNDTTVTMFSDANAFDPKDDPADNRGGIPVEPMPGSVFLDETIIALNVANGFPYTPALGKAGRGFRSDGTLAQYFFVSDATDIPEPCSLALLGAGFAGLLALRQRLNRRQPRGMCVRPSSAPGIV
jgi:PEP-CTERM motif